MEIQASGTDPEIGKVEGENDAKTPKRRNWIGCVLALAIFIIVMCYIVHLANEIVRWMKNIIDVMM